MNKPYYQDEWTTIYCGDSMKIIKEIGIVDLTLTDPPYGINGSKGTVNKERNKGGYISDFADNSDYIKDVVVPIIEECRLISKGVVLTPGFVNMMLYNQPDSFGCFYQPAAPGMQIWGYGDSQPIFYYGKNPTRKNMGKHLSFKVTEQAEKNGHPCVKPIGVWSQILENCSLPNQLILDPFMGSGTTLRAAKNLNRKAIGIELSEKYCEIAVNRLKQECFDFGI